MEGSSAAAEPDQLESSGKDKENAEDYISRELLRLSLTDRNAIQEEMHGVRCFAPKESPEMIQKSLEAFWVSFSALPEEKKVTFKKCQLSAKSNPDHYAFQPSFLLRFLRCELFNVEKAAIRYANYLDFAFKLYGEVVLQREFRFSDFNKDEIKGIRKGCYQLLPIRDQSGRRVVALVKRLFCLSGIDKRSKGKIAFYMFNSASFRDVESQRKGIICVSDVLLWKDSIKKIQVDLKDRNWLKQLVAAVSIRIVTVHSCRPDNPLSRMLSQLFAINIFPLYQTVRLKFHHFQFGDEMFMRYQLKTYGIPIELLPSLDSETVVTKNHLVWTKNREYFEEGCFEDDGRNGYFRVQFPNKAFKLIVDCPGSNDVLFRQGKNMMEHPGNIMFRNLIMSYLEQEEAWKVSCLGSGETMDEDNHSNVIGFGKHRFLNSWILDEICSKRQGRFLEWDRERFVWVLMADLTMIKNKVSIAFSKCRNQKEKSPSLSRICSKRGIVAPSMKSPVQQQLTTFCGHEGQDNMGLTVSHLFMNGKRPQACLEELCFPRDQIVSNNPSKINSVFVEASALTANSVTRTIERVKKSVNNSQVEAHRKRARKEFLDKADV